MSTCISLEGKVALVTGARRGIGKAIALALAEAGADVAVCDNILDGGELATVAAEVRKLGQRSLRLKTDVSSKPQVDHMIKRVVDRFGAIDILVNNAGIGGRLSDFKSPEDQFRGVLGVNLFGVFNCCQAVIPHMMERKTGNIISIASVEGFRGGAARAAIPQLQALFPDMPAFSARPYNVSKAGVIMLTKALARQLGKYNIRVNAIAPGGVRTDMIAAMLSLPDAEKNFQEQIPLGRVADPSEMGKVALFLASDLSSYVTGHTLLADGGLLA